MIRVFAVLILVVMIVSCSKTPREEQTTEADVPTELHGVAATIRSLGGPTLADKPLRLEHTLRNTSSEPVVLHDLANCVLPSFRGDWLCIAQGPTSEEPCITLAPGESVSRWVELTRGEPTEDWACRINVRCEGTGIGYNFVSNIASASVSFHIGYDDKLFAGSMGERVEAVLATPWLEVQLKER